MKTIYIEIAVAQMFNPRRCIIVPNVSWGAGFRHECDVLVIRPSGYALEVEIKTSASDLRADLKKWHGHSSNKIRELSYAVPPKLVELAVEILPSDVGVIEVREDYKCKTIRKPKAKKHARRMTAEEIHNVARLGCMRIWTLKRTLNEKQIPLSLQFQELG